MGEVIHGNGAMINQTQEQEYKDEKDHYSPGTPLGGFAPNECLRRRRPGRLAVQKLTRHVVV